MPFPMRLLVAAGLMTVPAIATAQSASPTLPSDTLEANFAPRSAPGPTPELAPTLPSDTLRTDEPLGLPGAQREMPDSTRDVWQRDERWQEDSTPDGDLPTAGERRLV